MTKRNSPTEPEGTNVFNSNTGDYERLDGRSKKHPRFWVGEKQIQRVCKHWVIQSHF